MEMEDIQRLTIVAGPNKIAYHFYPASGELVIWIGKYTELAPVSAQKTYIKPGMSEWAMENEE